MKYLRRAIIAALLLFISIVLVFVAIVVDQQVHSSDSDSMFDYEYIIDGYSVHKRSYLFALYKQVYYMRSFGGEWANIVVHTCCEPAASLGVKSGSVIVRWGDWTWNPDADFEHGCRAMYKETDRVLYEPTTVVWIDDVGCHEAQIGPGGFGVFVEERVLSKTELSGAFTWMNR